MGRPNNPPKPSDATSTTNGNKTKKASEKSHQVGRINPAAVSPSPHDDQFRVTYAESVGSPFQKTGNVAAPSPRYKMEDSKQAPSSSQTGNKTAA